MQTLCGEQGYTFTYTRLKNNQLQFAFTAIDTVFDEAGNIRKQLVVVGKLLQRYIAENGISLKQNQYKPNFKTWTFTIEAGPTFLDNLDRLLHAAELITADLEKESCRVQ